jgi:hypothetical protein
VNQELEIFVRPMLVGGGATVVMDLWALLLRRGFGIPSLDYRLLGRWIGHFPRGRFVHNNVAQSPPVPGERLIGWSAHYAIGIAFAALLLTIWGLEWARRPTLLPALIVALVTLVAPFLVMQPAMGAGIAASRTPKPNIARLRSVITHTVYGIDLYASTSLWARLMP